MTHRWYWVKASNGNNNTPNRMSIRTPLLKGPIWIMGFYHPALIINNTTVEIGFNPTPFIPYLADGVTREQPRTNGVGEFIATQAMTGGGGSGTIPRQRFYRNDTPLFLQDDLSTTGNPVFLNGFYYRDMGVPTVNADYCPLRMFIPEWQGCVTLSSDFTAFAGTGSIELGIEVIEDVLSVPTEVRDLLAEQGTFSDLFGNILDIATSPNALINIFAALFVDIFNNPGQPKPEINDAVKAYLNFLTSFNV